MLIVIAVLDHNEVQPSTIKGSYNQVENLIKGLKVLSVLSKCHISVNNKTKSAEY